MAQLTSVVHLITALLLIVLILLQKGKGGDMGAGFGSGASQTLFGSQGSASFLVKVIACLIAVFFTSSLALNIFVTKAIHAEKIANTPQVLQSDNLKDTSTLPNPDL